MPLDHVCSVLFYCLALIFILLTSLRFSKWGPHLAELVVRFWNSGLYSEMLGGGYYARVWIEGFVPARLILSHHPLCPASPFSMSYFTDMQAESLKEQWLI